MRVWNLKELLITVWKSFIRQCLNGNREFITSLLLVIKFLRKGKQWKYISKFFLMEKIDPQVEFESSGIEYGFDEFFFKIGKKKIVV